MKPSSHVTEAGVGMENLLAQSGQPEKSKATEKRCILGLSSKRAVVNLILLAVFVESASTQLLSDGVMVAHGPLEAIVMVRIHVGQPLLLRKMKILQMFAQELHRIRPDRFKSRMDA